MICLVFVCLVTITTSSYALSAMPHMFGKVCLNFQKDSDKLHLKSHQALLLFFQQAEVVPVNYVTIEMKKLQYPQLDQQRFEELQKKMQEFVEKSKTCSTLPQPKNAYPAPALAAPVFCQQASITKSTDKDLQISPSCDDADAEIVVAFKPSPNFKKDAEKLCLIPPMNPQWGTLYCTESGCTCSH